MNSKQKRIAVVTVIVLLAGLALLLFRGPMAPIRVTVSTVKLGNLQPQVFGVGTMEARYSYVLGPTQTGRLLKVHVDNGDRVLAGQVLAEIDPVDLEERVRSAAAAYDRSQYALAITRSQLEEAVSRNTLTQNKLKRYRELYHQQAISKELIEGVESEATVARAAEDAARFNLIAAGKDVEKYSAEHAAVLRQQSNLKLVSPVDGVVVSRESEPGSTVVAGQTVLKVADLKSLWVRVRIDQARTHGISEGQPVQVVLRSRQSEAIEARVARVDILSDVVAEERIVNVAFASVPTGVAIGELAEVTISLPAVHSALYIPAAALRNVSGQTGVWRLVEGKASFAAVKTGAWTLDGKVQVLSGLAEGEQVVVHSAVQLRDGLRVRAEKQL